MCPWEEVSSGSSCLDILPTLPLQCKPLFKCSNSTRRGSAGTLLAIPVFSIWIQIQPPRQAWEEEEDAAQKSQREPQETLWFQEAGNIWLWLKSISPGDREGDKFGESRKQFLFKRLWGKYFVLVWLIIRISEAILFQIIKQWLSCARLSTTRPMSSSGDGMINNAHDRLPGK